jgi:hypothetical protein
MAVEALPTTSYFSSRPIFALDGQENAELSEGLLRIVVSETSEGLYRAEVAFGNVGGAGGVGYRYFDRQRLDFGKSISISAGAGEAQGQLFEGRIMALEGRFLQVGTPEIVVLAEDRLQDLRMTRRTRTFEDASDSDVFAQIASGHSLTPDLDVTGPTYKTLAQLNQSDLAFIRERARCIDAEVWVEGRTLHVQARARRRRTTVPLTYGLTLRELVISADLAGQRTALTASGWDVSAKEQVKHEATDSAISGELRGTTSGVSLLQQKIGGRKEALVHLTPRNQGEARAFAEAHFRQVARRFVTGFGVCDGDPRIRVGTTLDLREVGTMFNGEYYVCEVEHSFTPEEGYRTRFTIERPGIGS